MNQENFNAWLEELRTTDKKQGREILKDADGGYCCLGIGCVLMGLEETVTEDGVKFDGVDLLAPPAFFEWLGVSWPGPNDGTQADLWPDWGEVGTLLDREFDPIEHISASNLNDGGFTFAQIADIFAYFGVQGQGA